MRMNIFYDHHSQLSDMLINKGRNWPENNDDFSKSLIKSKRLFIKRKVKGLLGRYFISI